VSFLFFFFLLTTKMRCLIISMQSTGLPKAHRPEQITVWNQNRRPLASSRQPVIIDLQVFITAFWKWWDALNPPWRLRVDGHLKIGSAGPWDSLYKPGQNGFLSVLQSLSWWRGLLGVDSAEEWSSALEDVTWVLGEVLNSLPNSDSERVGKRNIDTVDETRAGDDDCRDSHYASTTHRPKR
jgi:hypothetical protein